MISIIIFRNTGFPCFFFFYILCKVFLLLDVMRNIIWQRSNLLSCNIQKSPYVFDLVFHVPGKRKSPDIFFDAEISNNTYSFNSGSAELISFSSAVKRYSCIPLYIYFNFFALNGLIVHHNCIPGQYVQLCWDKAIQ